LRKQGSDVPKDVLHILEKELDMKSQQIEKQWEVIQSLNDRLREGNILMHSLQQRLALPAAEHGVSTKASTDAAKEAASKTIVENSTEASSKKKLFGWLRFS
jgi:hypothetical protein